MKICRSGSDPALAGEKPDGLTPKWLGRRVWGAIKPDLLSLAGEKPDRLTPKWLVRRV